MSGSAAHTVGGFSVLPLRYGHGKGSPVHDLYLRRHVSSREDTELPAGRTLFVVNVPPDASRARLRELFRVAGAVENVHLHALNRTAPDHDDEADASGDEEDSPTVDADAEQAGQKKDKRGPPRVEPLPSLEPNADEFLPTGSSAHIVFVDTSSLERALQLPQKHAKKPMPWRIERQEDDEEESARPRRRFHRQQLLGLEYLLARFRQHRPPHDRIKRHVDSAVARYTWIREHPQWLLEQRMRGNTTTGVGVGIQGISVGPDGELLDADGFTIVQKGGRYGRSGAEGSDSGTFAAITPEFEESLRENPDKKKARELPDFYRFQFRERKRQRTSKKHFELDWLTSATEFASLRTQFEADKAKVARLKATRRFKPCVHASASYHANMYRY